MENEIWKDIINYEGLYQVSSIGRVKSLNYKNFSYEKLMKLFTSNKGYYYVGLCKEGIKKTRAVHQLVAESFIGHIPCGYDLVINHINGIPKDNRVENLEIVTNRYNTSDGFKRIGKTSKYSGVCFSRRSNKWQCDIQINGKGIYLGQYENEEKASVMYKLALKHLDLGTFEQFYKTIKSDITRKKVSKYKGVSFNQKSGKWFARTEINGIRKSFGYFYNELDASEAYIKGVENIKKTTGSDNSGLILP